MSNKHSIKEWIAVTRYWSFPVSVMPVVATFAYLCSRHMINDLQQVLIFLLSIIGVVIIHSAGNVISDWADYRRGVDNEDAYAVPNLVFHKFEPKEYLVLGIILFVVGITIGVIISCISGKGLFLIGGIGVILTACYSFFKYHALGDLDIFIVFSVLIILGTSYACLGTYFFEPLILALPIGIITVSVLHANNTIDIKSDGKAGIKTFAMLLGAEKSCVLYKIYMIIPFICVIAAVIANRLHPLSLISLIAIIPAWKNLKAASHYDEKGLETMMGLDQASAKLQLLFSGMLSIGLFLSAIL